MTNNSSSHSYPSPCAKLSNLYHCSYLLVIVGKVLSIDTPGAGGYGKLRSRKFSAMEQEQALFGSDGIYVPSETEVLIIAGPRSKDVTKVMKISKKLTDATLIILLNARAAAQSVLSSGMSTPPPTTSVTADSESETQSGSFVDWVDANYVNVFHYAPPVLPSGSELDKKKELLLYHEFDSQWSLAEREAAQGGILGALGSLTGAGVNTLWQGAKRPTPAELKEVLDKLPPS